MNPVDKKLLYLYFSENCSAEEKKRVEEWANKSPKNQEYFYEVLEQWEKEHLKTNFNTSVEFKKVFNRILSSDYDESSVRPNRERQTYGYKVAAAVVLLLSFTMVLLYFKQDKIVAYSTGYGETKEVQLPDQSIVILNSNSSLTFEDNWEEKKIREVVLTGEAFFSVTHTVSKEKFVVKTADEVDIQVLGTEFNVKNRRKKTTVVLSRGKILLNIKDKKEVVTLTMQPGELVEVKANKSPFSKTVVNPERHSSWKLNKLEFTGTTVEEIALTLEDIYGKKILIADDSLKARKFTGTISRDNLEILLTGLSQAFDFQVIRARDEIIFKPNK